MAGSTNIPVAEELGTMDSKREAQHTSAVPGVVFIAHDVALVCQLERLLLIRFVSRHCTGIVTHYETDYPFRFSLIQSEYDDMGGYVDARTRDMIVLVISGTESPSERDELEKLVQVRMRAIVRMFGTVTVGILLIADETGAESSASHQPERGISEWSDCLRDLARGMSTSEPIRLPWLKLPWIGREIAMSDSTCDEPAGASGLTGTTTHTASLSTMLIREAFKSGAIPPPNSLTADDDEEAQREGHASGSRGSCIWRCLCLAWGSLAGVFCQSRRASRYELVATERYANALH